MAVNILVLEGDGIGPEITAATLAVLRADFIHVLGDGSGSDEADRLDQGMREQSIHTFAIAVHDEAAVVDAQRGAMRMPPSSRTLAAFM